MIGSGGWPPIPRSRSRSCTWLAIAGALALLPALVRAQAVTGTIEGRVRFGVEVDW